NRLEIDRVERGFGVTIDGTEARPNRIAQANRDYPGIVAEYGAVRTISDSLEPARSVLIEHLRGQYPAHADEFTEVRFNDGEIDLERFPVRRGRGEGRGELAPPAPAGHMGSAREERQGALQTHIGPFADPHLNRLHVALVAG